MRKSSTPPPSAPRDSQIWYLTATELAALLKGQTLYRQSRPFRIRLHDDVLERELESVVEKALR